MIGTSRGFAICAAAPTECANNGPKMISAPSPIACCAACWAPGAVPASSLTKSWRFGLVNSDRANSAALFIDSAARPALPLADSGRMRPTLTWPLPIAVPGCAGGGGAPLQKLLPGKPEQPATTAAKANATTSQARLVGSAWCVSPCVLPDTAALLHTAGARRTKRIMWANVRQVKAPCRQCVRLDGTSKILVTVGRSARPGPKFDRARAGRRGLIQTSAAWSDGRNPREHSHE